MMRNQNQAIIHAALLSAAIIFGGGARVFAQEETAPPTPAPPPSAANGAATAPAAADPLTGPIRKSDVIRVTVIGEATLSGAQRVSAEGIITLPLAGAINVVGKMPAEAAAEIAALYKSKELLRYPQVTVAIDSRPVPTVFVSGALGRQGRVEINDGTRLNEILEPAGLMPTSDLRRVTILRGASGEKSEKVVVDYGAYRTGNDAPDSGNNPLLKDGDKIYIYAAVQVAVTGSVQITGEVKTPQKTALSEGMTAFQAIQQAGGVTEMADRDQIIVLRDGKELPVPLEQIGEGQKDKDVVLQDKDEIFVRRMEKPKLFHVNGGVARASAFPLPGGKVTLTEALAMAGGPMDRVDTKKIVIQRKNESGEVVSKQYDLTKVTDASVQIQPDDIINVPFPPERKQKPGFFGILQAFSGIASLFTILTR